MKILNQHRGQRRCGASITKLAILIASPTMDCSISQTRAGKIQPHGDMASRINAGYRYRSSIVFRTLTIA
jgi:hypothetical protein